MTTRNMKKLGDFNEVFWNHIEEPQLNGIFNGIIEKEIDKEVREFAVVTVEDAPKPYLCGGRDLLNKLKDVKKNTYVEISFEKKDTFTPKGTKKKVPINRFSVSAEI